MLCISLAIKHNFQWLSSKESACDAGYVAGAVGQADSLEEGTATHSSILAWIISWTQEPGRLQSMGSQRDMTEHAQMHR